ncbi:multimeric flavodoxin WrbA [Bacilli bacterium PM5-3]|nr:multimeric flavodoxin WrbA [Bacilli bacterium PM5-3]
MKNILILNSSPRKNSNSNDLASEFARGALENGNVVKYFDCSTKNIKPCIACEKCWHNGKPCVFDDDSTLLQDYLFDADVLVFVTPVYWYSYSAQLKLAIDKFYPFVKDNSPAKLKVKECYLISCCHDDSKDTFLGLVNTFNETNKYMNWQSKDMLLVNNLSKENDAKNHPSLKDAYNMGKRV